MDKRLTRRRRWQQWSLGLFLVLGLVFARPPAGSGAQKAEAPDETMLMFVGEPLAVVTAASRRPESPANAPAVVTTVERAEIEAHGYKTLAQLLADQPGFYIASQAQGSVPYLRGIPNGVLLLYNGVPLTTEMAKSLHPLDGELSLDGVKRVEIIRGPGSVLWGPDAYAGIVNVVSFTGRDRKGLEVRAYGGSDGLGGGYIGWGGAGKSWDMFISATDATQTFNDDHYLSEQRLLAPGNAGGTVPPSTTTEVTANAHVGDWLTISGRYSNFDRHYTLHNPGQLSWAGEQQAPVSFLKADINKTVGASHWSMIGYYENVRYQTTDVDLTRKQENNIYNADLMWDRRIGQNGILTVGGSARQNQVDGAVVQGGFLPDYLTPENQVFIPTVQQANYSSQLYSTYAQYRQKDGPVEWWLGGRFDDHSRYKSNASYSLGANWALDAHWRIKAVGGTAYRSPYASQIYGGGELVNPEEISTASLQAAWESGTGTRVALTGFYSALNGHVQEDPYGGLSDPTSQKIMGLELESAAPITSTLDLTLGGSLQNHWGGGVTYHAVTATFLRPDGTQVNIYHTWTDPFNAGPGWVIQSGLHWRLARKAGLQLQARWSDALAYSYDENQYTGRYSQPVLLDATLTVSDVGIPGVTLTVRGQNILDAGYTIPGIYGPDQGLPMTLMAELAWRF